MRIIDDYGVARIQVNIRGGADPELSIRVEGMSFSRFNSSYYNYIILPATGGGSG